ncbi:hypothetical protein T03_7269 [Trichinella britovi]|uniref:Uncharacterized protein n=1 Tax=Trichinella britovi TaxID=45882 RepID=A0A0V0YW80_TRIBR|nr:hypothetical protein T03_7269 [Trichinella britovi]
MQQTIRYKEKFAYFHFKDCLLAAYTHTTAVDKCNQFSKRSKNLIYAYFETLF